MKVPREDRTSTDNRHLFGQILEEPYSHRYKVLTCSGIIKRLIPTKELGVVAIALWSDINIPKTTKEVTLGLAAREASTSAQVGISYQCNLVRGLVIQRGVSAIRKISSAVYTVIGMIMSVGTSQV